MWDLPIDFILFSLPVIFIPCFWKLNECKMMILIWLGRINWLNIKYLWWKKLCEWEREKTRSRFTVQLDKSLNTVFFLQISPGADLFNTQCAVYYRALFWVCHWNPFLDGKCTFFGKDWSVWRNLNCFRWAREITVKNPHAKHATRTFKRVPALMKEGSQFNGDDYFLDPWTMRPLVRLSVFINLVFPVYLLQWTTGVHQS